MAEQIAFFLGSGCSRPSGQPMVADITRDMVSLKLYLMEALDPVSAFYYELDGFYPCWGTLEEFLAFDTQRIAEELTPNRVAARSIQSFVRYILRLPSWRQAPNYEDVCGLLSAIAGAMRRGTNDPFVIGFLNEHRIVEKLSKIRFPPDHRYFRLDPVDQLMVIDDFVGWVVAKSMQTSPPLNGYEAFDAAVVGLRELGIKSHFITTNYDCNIEALLKRMKMPFHDGFPPEKHLDDAGRTWRLGNHLKFFKSRSSALIKLHGSMNWYRAYDSNGSGAGVYAVSNPELSPEDGFKAYIRSEQFNFTSKHAPEMLRGSISKAHVYAYSIYAELFTALEAALDRVRMVVVAGFGWNDEGIAARLQRFAHTDGKKLLILDGSQPSPAAVANGWTNTNYSGDVGDGKAIAIHRQHMSSMKKEELLALILRLRKEMG